jgi:tetratricopeptide (TPR) repeat protein
MNAKSADVLLYRPFRPLHLLNEFSISMKKKYTYLIIIFLVLVSCAAFGRIAGNHFICFDDTEYITQNSHIKSGIHAESIRWAFRAFVSRNWHPLTWMSLTLDYSLFGANPAGYHLINLLLHIGAVIFLFLFLYKTTNNIWPAAFAAALFALHPLRVESVAWAAERKDVLGMFFAMAALYSYAFYAETCRLSRYFLCLILFTLSLMAKSMLVTLPFILLLLDYWPLCRWQRAFLSPAENRFKSAGKLVLEKIPFLVLTIASSILTIWAQYEVGVIRQPISIRFINSLISYVSYLRKFIFPVDLAVIYPFEYSFPLWQILTSCFILLGITVVVAYYVRKMPFLFVGWFLYFGTLIPVIGLVPINAPMADRYTYLPSIGIAVMLAWGIPLLFPGENIRRKILFPAGVAVLAILSFLTWNQCGYWKNSISVFNHALRVTKNNYMAHNHMGIALQTEGKTEDALYHYNKAILINPCYPEAYNNRANIYASMGRYQNALEDFNKSIRLNPEYANTYNSRGTVYTKLGQYQQALNDFSKAIALYPDHANAHLNRGIIYAGLNQLQLALNDFNKAVSLKEDDADFYLCRGTVYWAQKDKNLGCRDAQKACELGNCKFLESAKSEGYCR